MVARRKRVTNSDAAERLKRFDEWTKKAEERDRRDEERHARREAQQAKLYAVAEQIGQAVAAYFADETAARKAAREDAKKARDALLSGDVLSALPPAMLEAIDQHVRALVRAEVAAVKGDANEQKEAA